MPQADSQSSNTPPLPPGYVLDSAGTLPPLPPGYSLDKQTSGQSTTAAPSMLDTAEHYGKQFLMHMGTAAKSFYPVRMATAAYEQATGDPHAKEAWRSMVPDAVRDFALAGGAEGSPIEEATPAVEVAAPAKTGPIGLRGIPGGTKSAGLGEIPVHTPELGEALGSVPAAKQPPPPTTPRPINVRGPGEIAPEMPRPRAFSARAVEPIPARSGLALPAGGSEAVPAEPRAGASSESIPRTLPGESVLRQVLTGQDNANLLKIARSRGINVAAEAQLKPGVADNRIINKIIEDFSPDELEELRDKGLEVNRFRHNFGEIGPEAWKTMGMQTYFPDVKIPQAILNRTQIAIARPGASPRPVIVPTPPTEDLTPMLKKSLRAVKARGINVAATGAND
jgi:hypothetical protein